MKQYQNGDAVSTSGQFSIGGGVGVKARGAGAIGPSLRMHGRAIQVSPGAFARVTVCDAMGRLVMSSKLDADQSLVSLEALAPGVYLVSAVGKGVALPRSVVLAR